MSSCCGSSKKEEKTPPETNDLVTVSCCGSSQVTTAQSNADAVSSCCDTSESKPDWLLRICGFVVAMLYVSALMMEHSGSSWFVTMSHTSFEMLNTMWWGILLGIFFVGVLDRIPREIVISVLGPGHSKRGIFRATLAGLLLDLCNHGILMVAMKLYERGASLGQVMAFLIASPWNSFTLTLILFALIGIKWTLIFIAASLIIAWISGIIFDLFEQRGVLPRNPNLEALSEPIDLKRELKLLLKNADYSGSATWAMLKDGFSGAKMVLRWIFFGIVLLALIRAFVPVDDFAALFGATVGGLFLTLLATTLIEVCSEGSSPIAADLVTRAQAPGNGFTFLMAGAATDYTEIMVLKDTTKSWKIALFLPLITVPQVLVLGYLMNTLAL